MGNKNHNLLQFNWQATNPAPFVPNTALTGVTNGVMTGTSTIYSNIIDVTLKDNLGLELAWTGTAVGTVTVYGSASGINFFSLVIPGFAQPAGSAGVFGVDLSQFPWKYIFIKYTNASGSGLLNVYMVTKDLN